MNKKNLLITACILFIFLAMMSVSYGSKMTLGPTPTPDPSEKIKEEKNTKITQTPTSIPLDLNYNEPTEDGNTPDMSKSVSHNVAPSFFSRLLNMGTSLIAVCILVYVVLKIFYAKGGGIIPQPKRHITLLEQIQLQPQKAMILSLVKVGEKVMLIGGTDKEISMLREFELAELPALAKKLEMEDTSSFKDQFSSIVEPSGQKGQPTFLSKLFVSLGLYGIAGLFLIKETPNKENRGN